MQQHQDFKLNPLQIRHQMPAIAVTLKAQQFPKFQST
jgi:hypothetical protein